MKYFTPNLLARCRSEDDAVAEPAREEWERANEEYERYLGEIRAVLPGSIRYLLRRLRLHDAKVFSLAFDEAPHFSIFVRPQGASEGIVELRYRLASPPRYGQHAILAEDGESSEWIWWLYDEIGIKESEFAFTHSILLTRGLEIQLTFYHLSCRHLSWAGFPPGSVIDPKTTKIPFVEGKEPAQATSWKQPRFLPLTG